MQVRRPIVSMKPTKTEAFAITVVTTLLLGLLIVAYFKNEVL